MKQDKLARQREYRRKNGNKCTNKYEKTINGFLMRKYRNMMSRIKGIQKHKAHLYRGKHILDRQDFYTWAKKSKEFYKLFETWEQSEYERKLCPTVDRIDSSRGYEIDNMEWVTHSENSKRGSINRNKNPLVN